MPGNTLLGCFRVDARAAHRYGASITVYCVEDRGDFCQFGVLRGQHRLSLLPCVCVLLNKRFYRYRLVPGDTIGNQVPLPAGVHVAGSFCAEWHIVARADEYKPAFRFVLPVVGNII